MSNRAAFLQTLLLVGGLLLSPWCLADRVQVSFALKHGFIESLLRQQVFTGAGDSLRFNDDGSGCQYLVLRQPRISASGGRILLRTFAEARAGRAVGGRCLLLLNWYGQLEFTQEPVVGDDRESIVLRTSSWRALRSDGSTATLSTTIGGWLEQFLPDNLRRTNISFAQPIEQLAEFLALIVTPIDASSTSALLESIAIDSVAADTDRATVTMGLEAPPTVEAPPQRAEPSLSDTELAQLQAQLDNVDAFFTYTIKSVTRDADMEDPAALLDVLVELRRELIAVLGDRQRPGDDPARRLFVSAWEGLTPSLRGIAEQQPDHESALQYLTFIGAGDALQALDDLGPATGIDVSSDGLRRLARMLIPDEAGDPLLRDDAVDPELRRSLGFGDPLPPPQGDEPTSWLDWLIPSAVAADALDPNVVKRLNNWVPKSRDMDTYLPLVRDVLRNVVTEQLRSQELDGTYHQLFRWLVFTTAWQESCWRQFVAKNEMRVPMQSGSGDVGIMQINPTVWRGFYDLHGLRWDIVYNARAGADILEHHLINYAIRHREHQTTGAIDNLARSTYAAYNGGPRQYDRYRRANASAQGKKVDGLFYEKYRQLKNGNELAVTACYTG